MKTAIFLYEAGQLSSLDTLIAKWSEEGEVPQIVSLDAEIDFALEKRGMPFVSGKTLQNRTAPSAFMRADELTSALCDNEALSFFHYRNVPLLEPLRFSINMYFVFLLYYVDSIERFMEGTPDVDRLVVPISSVSISKTSGPFAAEAVTLVLEAARVVAKHRGIHYESHDTFSGVLRAKNRWQDRVFAVKRALFGAALSLLNWCMALRPRRPIRVLASDYWRNISPIFRELPDAELILVDRNQALQAGFANIWRYKMRFMHIEQFLSRKGARQARTHAERCIEEWRAVRKEILASVDATFCGADLRAISERVMTRFIEAAVSDIIRDIEGSYAMYEHLSPDTVLLRASVSGQRHFAVLPLVAREVGIPALEVQHGGEYLGPGSSARRHAAYYLAEYGELVCDEFRDLGYARERLFAVGSPRFDAYIKKRREKVASVTSEISILSNTLNGSVGERYGTYSIEEYFHALGEAIRTVPNSRLLIASRSSSHGTFLKEARERGLQDVAYEDVGTTPLPELFAKADIFICSHSTVVYEALLCRLPVVIASFAPVEKMMTDFHFSRFKEAGALAIAHTPEELQEIVVNLATNAAARQRMSAAGWEFMQKNFSFDGHASERIASLVRAWVGVTGVENEKVVGATYPR